MSDAEQLLKKVLDTDNDALRVNSVGAPSGTYGTDLDWRQVVKKVYDSVNNELRVTVVP